MIDMFHDMIVYSSGAERTTKVQHVFRRSMSLTVCMTECPLACCGFRVKASRFKPHHRKVDVSKSTAYMQSVEEASFIVWACFSRGALIPYNIEVCYCSGSSKTERQHPLNTPSQVMLSESSVCATIMSSAVQIQDFM